MTFSSGLRAGGRQMTGFRAAGSELLLGRTLILHETSMRLDRAQAFVTDLIDACLDEGTLFDDGEIVRLYRWPVCEIRHRAPSEINPYGTFEVMLNEAQVTDPASDRTDLRSAFGRREQDTGIFARLRRAMARPALR